MGITERRIRQKEEVKSSILDTAWNIVKQEGWQSLSIRKIADAIEYSVPVVYDHFENKEAILQEFAKKGFECMMQKMQKAKKKSEDPGEQLKLIADAYWDFAFGNKEYYQLMFGLGIACCEAGKCMPEKSTSQELVLGPIELLLKKNKNQTVNSCLKYHTYWSIMHGLISIKMIPNTNLSDDLNKLVLQDAIAGFIKNLES